MKDLNRQTRIISESSPFNGQIKDILINNGIITRIADHIQENADQIIQEDQLCTSPGWMDIFADFADPGFESRESLESGAKAAAAGGFTDIMLIPNTNPIVHNKSQVEYLVQKAGNLSITIHPIGTVTKNAAGTELSEMYDMRQSGALAFSDGINSIQNAGLLVKALQYVKAIDGTIIQLPDDKSIGQNGLMNEGITSTQLGLPGKPAMAEELMVARDIKLARYTDSKLHFTGISTRKSLEYIRRAKAGGIQVTCSVTPYQLYFCDEDLQGYDTNLKLNPPLRSREDMLDLRRAINEGDIDCIASHHFPQDWDGKTCEFEYAKPGMIGLETMFAVLNTLGCSPDRFVAMQSVNTRKIFGLPISEIKEGEPAVLTLFNPDLEYVFTETDIRSKSRNTPFTGKTLKGKVTGIINKGKIEINLA